MKAEKQRLTRLSNIIKEKFPDGEDIYGYSGINKTNIIKSMDNTYTYLGLLENVENEAEMVWVKRKLSKYFDDLSLLLKEIDSDSWKDKFNIFLDIVFEMRMHTKELYISLTDNPIRTDEQIQEAQEKLKILHVSSASIEDDIKIIKENKSNSDQLIILLKKLNDELATSNQKGTEIIENISEIENDAGESDKIIKELTPQLKTTFSEIKDFYKTLTTADENIQKMSQQLVQKLKNVEEIETKLQEQTKKDAELQSNIKQTLQDVNKHGMAGAFYKRKNELKVTVVLWGLASVISIGIFIALSYIFTMQILNSPQIDPLRDIYKIPSLAACVWLGWFCIKQFGYSIRIGEDYSYKYAISMAFEGYKNETRDINEDLLEKLLAATLVNISSNPTTLYNSKSNHGSPWHELTEGIKNFFKVEVKADVTADTKDIPKLPGV
ncbi:hypothetical protein AGMMS49942_13840 [Spirochaetia bacterium]|nr:hypothetical protein AGMMS49942_13840 [Spirochaetia bacterium]